MRDRPAAVLAHELRELAEQASILADLAGQAGDLHPDTVSVARQAVCCARLLLDDAGETVTGAADPMAAVA